MNDISEIVRTLQHSLLESHYGLDERSYLALEELIGEVFGEEEMETLADSVDCTDGFYYYPEGNTVDENDPTVVESMRNLLATLDERSGDVPEDEEEEPEEVDLYDDLAD